MVEANWLVFLAALVVGIAVAYWIFAHGSKKPGARSHRPDVLDEGAAPAQRNQALIDSDSPASQYDLPVPGVDAPEKEPVHLDPPAAAGTMAGIGEVIAVAAQDEADSAREQAEPEPVPAPGEPSEAAAPESDTAPEPDTAREGEPSAPTSEPAPESAPEPVVAAPAASAGEADNLRKIKGLGPKMEKLLISLGITRYAQIAQWSESDLDELDGKLGAFAGRPRRDKWVEQARLLAGGDTSAYEAEFGKL